MFVCDEHFSRIMDELKCGICTDLMLDPVMLKECGHSFCNNCIDTLNSHNSQYNKHCPACRTRSLMSARNHGLRTVLHMTTGSCSQCSWSGTFGDFGPHMCILAVITCSNEGCSWEGEQEQHGGHLTVCQQRKKECPFCGIEVKWCELLLHMFACTERTIMCPVPGCNIPYKLSERQAHDADRIEAHMSALQNLLLGTRDIPFVMGKHHSSLVKFIWNEAKPDTISPLFHIHSTAWQMLLKKDTIVLTLKQSLIPKHITLGVVINRRNGKKIPKNVWREGDVMSVQFPEHNIIHENAIEIFFDL